MFTYTRLGGRDLDALPCPGGLKLTAAVDGFAFVVPGGMRRVQPILQFQPVHSLRHGTLAAAEIGLGRADAESSPVHGPHRTSWLLYAACVQIRLLGQTLPMTVALPPGTRLDAALVAQARSALHRSGIGPGLLTLALSEAASHDAALDGPAALAVLRDSGVGVAIGSSADGALPRVLGRMAVAWLRLHPSLVRNFPDSRPARAAVADAVEAAHAAGARVSALGVDNPLQRDILADLGVDAAAGAVFGPALAASAFRRAVDCALHA